MGETVPCLRWTGSSWLDSLRRLAAPRPWRARAGCPRGARPEAGSGPQPVSGGNEDPRRDLWPKQAPGASCAYPSSLSQAVKWKTRPGPEEEARAGRSWNPPGPARAPRRRLCPPRSRVPWARGAPTPRPRPPRRPAAPQLRRGRRHSRASPGFSGARARIIPAAGPGTWRRRALQRPGVRGGRRKPAAPPRARWGVRGSGVARVFRA